MYRKKTSYLIEFLMHAVFWVIAYYALKALAASSFLMEVNNNGNIARQDGRMPFPYAWVVLVLLMVLFYSSTFWIFTKTIYTKPFFKSVLTVSGWLLMLYGLNYFIVYLVIGKPLTGAPHSGIPMPPGPPAPPLQLNVFSRANWLDLQPVIALVFILVAGLAAAYFYVGESVKKELQRSQAKAERANTELKFLRSQVNPHFLFNTLNNLFSLAQGEGKDNVADKIAKLSGMMRYMIYDSNAESVPLEKEIIYLQDCIALHQLRYPDSQVSVSFRYPDENTIAGLQLAPMLLISFVENAFKHGIYARHRSFIAMELKADNEKLIFTCENSDHSIIKKAELEQGGIGLGNVRRRLELLYPGKYRLVTGTADGVYHVNLEINLL